MTTVAEVRLWGTSVGAVSMGHASSPATFEYDPRFLRSGIEVSPLMLPLRRQPYDARDFPTLPTSFRGLPGLLADSLPDRFGNAVVDAWLGAQGRDPGAFNAAERLCYTGRRGMGALEFFPARGPRANVNQDLQIAALVELASDVVANREQLVSSLSSSTSKRDAMQDILQVGTSAGGARAKAVVAFNSETQAVRSGQLDADEGFEHWLLKFDGVSEEGDREGLVSTQGYGAIEYAYSVMARRAGIAMSECRLLEENGRRHFMTRRFDRPGASSKLHMLSLAAIAHLDFNQAGAHSYEEAYAVMRRLGLTVAELEEQFRRATFNIVSRNQDDHVKNIAFLMDRDGTWSLSPAFDVSYAYNPSRGRWTAAHQMALNGKRDDFARSDLRASARTAGLKRGRADDITGQILDAVSQWREIAAEVGVADRDVGRIQSTLRLDLT